MGEKSGMGDTARFGLRRCGLRHVAWVLLLLLAACAQPHAVPTAPSAPGDAATASKPQIAAIPPEPLMPAYQATPEERKCLALAVYFESRAETVEGQHAVAAVVLNRVRSDKFPDSICGVVHEGGGHRGRCQFSWYCDGRSDEPHDAVSWQRSLDVADAVLNGEVADPTDGALYFHSTAVRPKWRKKMTKTAAIDNHVFYR
jgi:spore germination cell wall hydrolase CwlJ-like protein